MADIKDVKTVIASALAEIGVSGTLDVAVEGAPDATPDALPTSDDLEIVVVVKPAEVAA